MAKERNSFFQSFNSEFEKLLPQTRSYQQAFEQATNKFNDSIGASPYSTWNSFKAQRSKHKKK